MQTNRVMQDAFYLPRNSYAFHGERQYSKVRLQETREEMFVITGGPYKRKAK